MHFFSMLVSIMYIFDKPDGDMDLAWFRLHDFSPILAQSV